MSFQMSFATREKVMPVEYDYRIPKNMKIKYNKNWHSEVHESWKQCNTYLDLIKTMNRFIRGEIPNTPEHLGELQDYDPNYISKLLTLNEMGILSCDGQEFKQTITRNEIYMQREYIAFAYKLPSSLLDPSSKQHLEELLSKFNNADFYYYAVTFDEKQVYQTPGLGELDYFYNPECWLTRTINRIDNSVVDNHTHIPMPEDMLNGFGNFQFYAKDFYPGTVFFEVWAKTWDETPTYLLDRIIPIFNN